MSKAQPTGTKLRDIEIVNKLRKGVTPSRVIQWAIDEYDLAPSSARDLVYKLNTAYRKSVKELCDDAAEYLMATLIADIEDCEDKGDKKNKIKCMEMLAKVTKVFDDKPSVTVNNYGFEFGDAEKDN